jgi:ribosome biogenesis GTPase
MHILDNGGYIIDTPGIKGFGIVDIPKNELHHYFPEMFALLPDCKFHNCLHIGEPKCAVKLAVENGQVPESRYKSYTTMYSDDEDETYRAGY